MILKRAQKGTLPLVEAVMKLQAEIMSGPSLTTGEIDMVANAKKVALFVLGVAYQKFTTKIDEQQEVVANITDVLINTYAMESASLRARKIAGSGKNAENVNDMLAVFSREAMDTIESCARTVLAACSEGDALRTNLGILKRFTKYEPVDLIGTRRRIAARLIQAERYVV